MDRVHLGGFLPMRQLALLLALGAMAACSSRPRIITTDTDREDLPAMREVADKPLTPLVTAKTPPLRALPQGASFAWVEPTKAFTGMSRKENESAAGATRAVRESIEIVLNANGWRAADADSADFHLTMVRTERRGTNIVMRPDPRSGRQQPRQTCPKVQITGNRCYDPPPANYPPVRSVEPFTERLVGYSIIRATDNATRVMIVPSGADESLSDLFARLTVEMLLNTGR